VADAFIFDYFWCDKFRRSGKYHQLLFGIVEMGKTEIYYLDGVALFRQAENIFWL
jgi:hypothetical protein